VIAAAINEPVDTTALEARFAGVALGARRAADGPL
jgi:hypothetical protein